MITSITLETLCPGLSESNETGNDRVHHIKQRPLPLSVSNLSTAAAVVTKMSDIPQLPESL